jgi:hypothetical protein
MKASEVIWKYFKYLEDEGARSQMKRIIVSTHDEQVRAKNPSLVRLLTITAPMKMLLKATQ